MRIDIDATPAEAAEFFSRFGGVILSTTALAAAEVPGMPTVDVAPAAANGNDGGDEDENPPAAPPVPLRSKKYPVRNSLEQRIVDLLTSRGPASMATIVNRTRGDFRMVSNAVARLRQKGRVATQEKRGKTIFASTGKPDPFLGGTVQTAVQAELTAASRRGISSGEIGRKHGIPSRLITASIAYLERTGRAKRVGGKGGKDDPYRYKMVA